MEFNPQKDYQWKANDEFILYGGQLDLLMKNLRIIINSPESQKAYAALDAYNILQATLAKGIEQGFVTEVKKEEAPE